MLVGYVSDEKYVALADVGVEFTQADKLVVVVKSTPSGRVYADIAPGEYRVTLVKAGFGSKRVTMTVDEHKPYQFRLLSDCILGYMWPKWVKAGEKSEFRIHAPEAYRLSLWRYGLQKEFVRLISWIDEHGPRANTQLTPDGDYTQTGVQWNKIGHSSPQHHQLLTGPQRSGLYYLHVQSESGAFFCFPWVVAPATPQAKIAVLASTNTWNAYNNFGGRSNYINGEGLPPTPTIYARQDLVRYTNIGSYQAWGFPDDAYQPLSFERPEPGNFVLENEHVTDPIQGRQQCHLAPAEWRLLGWLEREGFAYDLYAESQLHFDQLDLDAYKVLIISTHPEYWSRAMYEKVKDWVYNRGGKFMYLGGNGLNCEVEFLDETTLHFNSQLVSSDGGVAMRDPDNPEIVYESRLHRRVESEANLLGVVYSDPGVMTAAPYAVKKADHWVFAGTELRNGDVFGEASLHERIPGGASGHETDKMSPHSPPNTILLAKGTNIDDGGAEMIYYETDSGGATFSVGSITWPASILVDKAVSRITANVITKFLA